MAEAQTGECRNRIFLISLALVIVGIADYFILRGHWAFYPLAHAGALGVLGLLGASAGLIARAKGYNFTKAFLVGFLVPIIVGVVAVFAAKYLGGEGAQFYCGGSVCLATAIVIIVVYTLLRRKAVRVPYIN